MRKLIFFIVYILVSISIIVMTFTDNQMMWSRILISAITFFFLVALKDHYKEITD